MTKIVFNGCYGGFSLSDAAIARYAQLKGMVLDHVKDDELGLDYGHWEHPNGEWFDDGAIERDDPALVKVVEELGALAWGSHAMLLIRELPKGTRYRIEEYDGSESVRTFDSYEWRVA